MKIGNITKILHTPVPKRMFPLVTNYYTLLWIKIACYLHSCDTTGYNVGLIMDGWMLFTCRCPVVQLK